MQAKSIHIVSRPPERSKPTPKAFVTLFTPLTWLLVGLCYILAVLTIAAILPQPQTSGAVALNMTKCFWKQGSKQYQSFGSFSTFHMPLFSSWIFFALFISWMYESMLTAMIVAPFFESRIAGLYLT